MMSFFWIIEFIASFAEIAMCCVFCGIFLAKEKSEDYKYLTLAGSSISAVLILILNRIDIFSFSNSIIVLFVVFLLQMLIYKTKPGLCVALTLVYAVILAAFDFLVAYFTAFLINTDVNYLLNNQSLPRVLCTLMSKSLLVITVVTMNRLLNNTRTFIKKYVAIMFIYSIFLLISLFIMVELNINNRSTKIDLFLVVFFSAAILIELLLFYFVIKTGERYEQQQKTELILMKNDMLQKSLDETEQAFKLWQKSVHDYKNNIIALRQLAEDENLDGIKEYLSSENELINKKMFCIKTGHSVVDTIVNTKQRLAEEKGITFIVNATIPEKCLISELDLANILGNLIDNAIEASTSEKEPYIDLTIRQEKTFFVIKIVNKYSQELSEELKTTKKKQQFHGIGLGSVTSVIKKYEGEFSIDKEGEEVVAKALIPNGIM
ncbi:MAG: GHKL domain-containing protein [Lachnospiraceae bacterium]|nr:GHKL domain-containing protein [Lachnospiraceae bacterium]